MSSKTGIIKGKRIILHLKNGEKYVGKFKERTKAKIFVDEIYFQVKKIKQIGYYKAV